MDSYPVFNNFADSLLILVNAVDRIVEKIKSADYSKVIDSIVAMGEYASYICALEEIKWPLYNVRDNEFRQAIVDAHKSNCKSEQINEIVFSFFSTDQIVKMKERWLSSTVIKPERLDVLAEAVNMHNLGYYYASTSILMCQLYGVSNDIVEFSQQQGIELNEDDKKEVSDFYNMRLDKLKHSEKGQLMQMLFISDISTGTWYSFAKYIKEIVLDSSSTQVYWSTQPLRNKICHGNQLCYGTKEHSLKAILIIDLLFNLADELKYYAEHHTEECNDE